MSERTTIPTLDELDGLNEKIEFFDVDGIPVAVIDDVEVYRFDTPTTEWFPMTSIMSEGVEITKEQFNLLAKQSRATSG